MTGIAANVCPRICYRHSATTLALIRTNGWTKTVSFTQIGSRCDAILKGKWLEEHEACLELYQERADVLMATGCGLP